MDKKNTPKTNERFAVEPQVDNLLALPEQSQQLLDQLISYLRTQGGAQDLDMAMALEAQGWMALSSAQIQLLMQQLHHVAQAYEAQMAQAAGTPAVGSDAGNLSGAALSTPASGAAPASATNGQEREASVAFNARDVISRLDSILPVSVSETTSTQARFNADPAAPALGATLLNALTTGAMPAVSGSTVLAANAGAPLAVTQPGTPSVQVPITASGASAVAVLPTLDPAASSAAATSGTSTSSNTVSRMPAQSSLGGNVLGVNNAAVLVPYVVQQVSTTGTLVSTPVVQGSTESGNTRTTTSYVQPSSAEVVGGTVAITQPSKIPAPAAPEVQAPPNPFGDVVLSFDSSMLGVSDRATPGDNIDLLAARKILEGTSAIPDDATPVRLVVERVNPMMPDDIPFVISGLQGLDDLVNVLGPDVIELTVDPDGTVHGKVSFKAGQTTQVLTINVRKDPTVEFDEPMTIRLEEGLFGKLLTGNHALTMTVRNDDMAAVSIAPDADQIVEGTDADGYVSVTFTVTRQRPAFQDPDIPLPADAIGWHVVPHPDGAGAGLEIADVLNLSGQVSFAEGQTTATITVRVKKDAVPEDLNEVLTVALDVSGSQTSVAGGAIQASTILVDDDGLWRVDLASGQDPQVDEGTGTNQTVEAMTVTGSSQSAIAYLPSGASGGTVLQTSHRLSDFDPYMSSFVFGGAYIGDDEALAEVRQVVKVSTTRMTFWTLTVEGVHTKAIKVQVDELPNNGGLKFAAVAQKYYVNSNPDSIADLEVGGTPMALAGAVDAPGYGLHDIEAVFRTTEPATTSVTVADATHFLTLSGTFVAGHSVAEFQPYSSTFNLGGNYIGANSLPKTVREVDWLSPGSMNFWVSMSDPQYTKAIKVHAEDVVVNGAAGVRFNVVSAQYINNNGQTYQVLGDFGVGYYSMGVAQAPGQNGYGLNGFTAVFANDADNIPTESVWLSDDANYLQTSGVVVNTAFTLDQFDAAHTVLQIGGGDVLDDAAQATVYQVDDSDIANGNLTFWAAAVDEDGTVKAVKILAHQGVNGIEFSPIEAKEFGVADPETIDFEADGNRVNAIAARDDASGIGIHHFDAAFAIPGETYTTQTLSYVVTRTNGSQADTVAYHIEGIQTSDLADPNSGELDGVLVFAPGETSKTVTIIIRQDGTVERNESATIVLDDTDSLYAHTDPEFASATVDIANDDFLEVGIVAASGGVWEGNDSDTSDSTIETTPLTFTITRSKPAGVDDSDGWPEEDIAWSLPDPYGQIVLRPGMSRDPDTGVVSGVVHFEAQDPGSDSQSIELVLQTDRNDVQEADWQAQVALAGTDVSHVSESAPSASTWILDDDPTIAVDPNPPTILEGGVLRFTINRSTATNIAFDVAYQLLPTSGGAGYISSPLIGTVHFNAGDPEAYIDVQTLNDGIVNEPRQVVMNVTGVRNLEDADGNALAGRVYVSAGSSVGTITNDDAEISIQSIEASSPDPEGNITFTVTVSRAGAQAFLHGVKWAIVGVGENPLDPLDVQDTTDSRVVLFEADAPDTQTFTFKAPAGMIIDGQRTFEVRLQDLSAGDVSDASDIADRTGLGIDAIRGSVIPNGVSASVVPVLTNLAEGSGANGATHIFKVVLSEPSDSPIEIGWNVHRYGTTDVPGSDEATGNDFKDFGGNFPSGVLTIPAHTSEYTFSFSSNPDSFLELTEKFLVGIEVLSGPAGVVGAEALGSIVNDDAEVGFRTSDEVITVNEGMDGVGTVLKAEVLRTGFVRSEISVAWRVELIDDASTPQDQRASYADLFNVPDADHLPSGRLTILAGQRIGNIEIPLFGDNVLEASEKFRIVLLDEAAPNDVRGGASLISDNAAATAVIRNDDAVIRMDNSTFEVKEDDNGGWVTIHVVRDTQGEELPAATVQWIATATGVGSTYADKTDFLSGKFPSGTATFAAGSNVAEITFRVNADDMLEGNESFVINLIGTTTAQHSLSTDPALLSTVVTLNNDDDVVAFSTSGTNLNQSLPEDGTAHAGQTITYTLIRTGDTTKSTTVHWHLDFTNKTARASDFENALGDAYEDSDTVEGTAVFNAGDTTATIVLKPVKDVTVESNETFAVVLDTTGLSANGTRLATSNVNAQGTLENDDIEIAVVESASVTESASGTVTITFTVSRSGDTANQATDLSWSVNGSTIVVNGLRMADALGSDEFTAADNDLSTADPVLHWAAGDITTRTITVTVNGDTLVEGDEAVKLTLANTGSAPEADLSQAVGKTVVVHDNDARVWVEALAPSVTEGRAGESHNVTFRIYREGDISSGLSVALSHSGASGVTGPAFATFPDAGVNTEYLNNGMARQYVDVTYAVAGDDILEVSEQLQLTLGATTPSPGFNAVVDTNLGVAQTAIANDDNAITISSNVTSVLEGAVTGNAANPHNTVTFTLTRDASGKLGDSVVEWRLAGAGQNQVNELDFDSGQEDPSVRNNGLPSGTVRFVGNQLTADVTVTLSGDLTVEPNEGMKLVLTAPAVTPGNLEVANPDYSVTVEGDDVGINVLARDAAVTEGNNPTVVRSVFFDVVRMGPTTPIYWKLITDSDSNTDDATASDFVALQATTGELIFDANGGALVQLVIKQDSLEEDQSLSSKPVTVGLFADADCQVPLINNGVHYTATTLLKDDDATLTVVASSGASVGEGSDPNPNSPDTTYPFTDDYTTLTFTVNRTGNTDQISEVPWSVALGNGLTTDDFYDGITSGTLTFEADGTTFKTITLKVKKDWLEEDDETVTVVLGTPSAGTSLAGGSQSASTTVIDDDVTVQFATNSLSVSAVEGDSGTGAHWIEFDVTRSGDLSQTSTVTWTIRPQDTNSADFEAGRSADGSDQTYSYDAWSGLPTGTVTFNPGDPTTKTVKVYITPDNFRQETWNNGYSPFTQSSKLEGNEAFTIELSSGSTSYSQRGAHYNETVQSIGTLIGQNATAVGTILNDDIKIQITDIHTNLPEGTAPDSNGDVDPAHTGIQTSIEQFIKFERTGDLSREVSFDWVVNTANFSAQMVQGQATHGTVTFAAWDATKTDAENQAAQFATITFRPQGDDAIEPNYSFTLEVTQASAAIDEFSFGTDTGLIVNRTPRALPLATFNVMRDEAGVWVTNEVVTSYNNWNSQQDAPVQTYSSADDYSYNNQEGPVYVPGDTDNINYTGPDARTQEGSLGTAQAGADYTAVPLTTLTFDEQHRTQTVTIAINDDGTYETREGLSLFLNGAQHATVADAESLVTIVDNDNPTPSYQVNVTGSTAIEGLDDTVNFTVELGKGLTQESTFDVVLSNNSQAALSRESGEAGDITRYFEYSTDGGDTWQTHAPVFDFTYTAPRAQAVDDQLTVAYSFDNSYSNHDSWDSWLEFSDLKKDVAGQRVGNTLMGATFGDGNGGIERIDVVVDWQGGWIDTDGDRVRDNSEQDAFGWYGDDWVGLSSHAVSITFIDVPNYSIDLSGFGLDDRIYIDKQRFEDNGYSCYGASNYVQDANGSGSVTRFDWYKGYTSSGEGGLRGTKPWADALAVGQGSDRSLYAFGWGDGGWTSASNQLGYNIGNNEGLSNQEIFDRVSFVNVGQADKPVPAVEHQEIWIAVRADAVLQANDMAVQIAGSGSKLMDGAIGGVLDLAHVSTDADVALRADFLAWWNQSFEDSYAPATDDEWASFSETVQNYFDQFASRLTDGPAVKFVQVNINWDGYGEMSWSVAGLDPTVVLAPQNDGPFSHLQLLQDITVEAGQTSASADVALGAQAIFNTENSVEAVSAQEATGLQPSFHVTNDSIDANGVRTVTVSVERAAGLGEDVVSYHLNMGDLVDNGRLLPGSARLDGSIAFEANQSTAELTFQFNALIEDQKANTLPVNLHVIVDHFLKSDGTDAVGAFIDQDKDGVLDAAEAVDSNRAFAADGSDLIGVNTHKVTITFNDFTDTPLDLEGFGGDDRIQINLDELGRYWKVGTVTEYSAESSSNDKINTGSACTTWDLSGQTPQGRSFRVGMEAWRDSIWSSDTAHFTFNGYRWTENGSNWARVTFAEFGSGEGQNPIIDGYLSLASQVSFVHNPTVYVVVQANGAYIDLDKDGVLDDNENNADNLAFNADGSEANAHLARGAVVLHFNDAPDTALDLRNFGMDDRIEIDVAAFKEHGWNLPAAEVQPRQNWEYLSSGSGEGAVALVYSPDSGAPQDWFGVRGFYSTKYTGCYNTVDSNSIWVSNAAGGACTSQQLGNFGTHVRTGDHHNRMVDNDAIWGRISFVNINGNQPAQDVHVVVDHYLDANQNDVVGAFIDLDKDGVLDANEATAENMAFHADGTVNSDLIDFSKDHVTVRFNDVPGSNALDFTGFGADDRVEINLNQLAANGWLIPDKLTSDEMSISTNYGWAPHGSWAKWSSRDISGYMSTRSGNFASLTVRAGRTYDGNRWLELEGAKYNAEGSNTFSWTKPLAQFSDQFQLIGRGELLNQQVAFVRDPQVHIVVDKGQAYFDLDADGKLDANEYNSDNYAFDGEGNPTGGLDLAHQTVTIRFNDFADNTLNLSGFGRDDRIEIDLGKLNLLGVGQALVQDRSYNHNSNSNGGWDYGEGSHGISAWARHTSQVQWSNSTENSYTLTVKSRQWAGQGWCSSNWSAYQGYSNKMWLAGHTLATFGQSQANQKTVSDHDINHNPFHLIDANGGMLNRVSFVNTVDPLVLVKADGGWLDLNHDGILQDAEQTDANRAFAADGSALIHLADDAYTLRFLDTPDQALDFSGFDFNDKIEIDLSQMAVRGHYGAGMAQNAVSNASLDSMLSGTSLSAFSNDAPLAAAAYAGATSEGAAGLYFRTKAFTSINESRLADFGNNSEAAGQGRLADGPRLSFVNSTVHVVVDANGAYLDENGNGKVDANENVALFDPITGAAAFDLRHQQTVITFNGAPEVPLDLSNFGSDDRIEINRSAFHAAGWEGANAQSAFNSTYNVYCWSKGFSSGNGNEAEGSSYFAAFQTSSELGIVAGHYSSNSQRILANFGHGEMWWGDVLSHVSFVQDKVIDGFAGDDAISIRQGGHLSGGVMQYDNTITAEVGTDKILVRVPVVNDNIDEKIETIDLTVTNTGGNEFVVPEGSGTSTLVDDDSPRIDVGTNVLYDGQLQQYFVVKTIDINNRDAVPSPHTGYGDYTNNNTSGTDQHYYSDSVSHDAGAAQSFTVTLRCLGQWDLALIGENMSATGQGYLSSSTLNNSVMTYTDAMHNSTPPFLPVTGVAERNEDGELTGYFLYEVQVPAGTKQVLMRSTVGADEYNLTAPEIEVRYSFSATITHVDPIIVARDVLVDENTGTATVKVVAVGGDMGNDGVSVDVQTVDGQWIDRTFIVSREYATVGELTLHWSVEALGGAGQGVLVDNSASDYVAGYFGHTDTSTVNADDFVLIDGQQAGNTVRSPGLPTGTVTFADGQKEAIITVRVRADNVGEEKEDFRVVLAQPPAGVQLLGNPDAPQTYANGFDSAGYARIVNDDQLFTIKGIVINEAKDSKVTGQANGYQQDQGSGMAIDGTPEHMTAPEGYTLHQFIITREGDSRAAASVDYVFQVKGIDVAGFIETTALTDQGLGAHQAETADFLAGGAYGFTWTAPVNGVTSSVAKTVVFAAGESQKVVTFAVANDELIEDAEQFTVALTNPQALPGNDGNPGVSELRGSASFLIGDNDGTKVSVSIGWLDNASDASVNALSDNLGNAEVDDALYEGTSSDWLTNGNNDDSNDDLTNDRRVVLTFTRSNPDATASQAFFEIDLSHSHWAARDMVLESGAVSRQWYGSDSSWWRGTVDFAPDSDTATVVFRVPDDNLIEPNQTLTVTLYDAEHLPQSGGTTRWSFNDGTAALADTAGIGDHTALPDWNTTIRDPNAYQATATVVDDDVRLWLGSFGYHNGNIDWTPDGDADTSISNSDQWEAYTITEGNPTDGYTPDQDYVSGNGDFVLSFGRAGVQSGDIQLNWAVTMGTTDFADFNTDYWVDAQGQHTTDSTLVTGVRGSLILSGSNSTSETTTFETRIAQLLAVDREVEGNETFQLTFSVDGAPANVLFTPDYQNEAPNSNNYTSYLQGRGAIDVDVVALNDDVVYGIALASVENGDNTVVEGDLAGGTIRFDVTRQLGGYHDASTVGWRIVAKDGYDITASDFVEMSGVVRFDGLTWNGSTWNRPLDSNNQPSGTDVHQLLTIQVNRDAEVEYGEHFYVELYNPSVGYVDTAHNRTEAVIVNDDTGLLINNFSMEEGDTGTTTVTATVVRVGDLSGASTFNWAKYNVDTNSADFDATGATTGTATIGANSSITMVEGFGVETYTLTTTVKLKGDAPAVLNAPVGSVTGAAAVEGDEKFRLVLDNVSGIDQMLAKDVSVADTATDTVNALNSRDYALSGTTSASAYGTVLNDDTIFSVTPVTVSRNESSTTQYAFTITRSVATPQSQTVTWSVLAEGGRNVVDGKDFGGANVSDPLPTGTVTFSGDSLSETIYVDAPSQDLDPEADEVFTVKVTAFGTGAGNDMFVTTGTGAKGVIVNDDAAVYINDSQPITQIEGSGSTTQYYKFDVVRSGVGVTGTSTVDWKVQLTADGAGSTAQIGDFRTLPTTQTDSGWYDAANNCIRGTVMFSANDYDLQTVSLALNPDSSKEATESFVISLDNPTNRTSIVQENNANNATGKIGDDDYDLSVKMDGIQGPPDFGTLTELDPVTYNGVTYPLYKWNGEGTNMANVLDVLKIQPWYVPNYNYTANPVVNTVAYNVWWNLPDAIQNNLLTVISIPVIPGYVTSVGNGYWPAPDSYPRGSSGFASATIYDPDMLGGTKGYLISTLPVKAPDEGDGNASMQFTVTRDGATDLPANATWTLVFGNSNAAALAAGISYAGAAGYADSSDFRAVTGNFVFPAGASTYTFTVPVAGDLQWEENEVFALRMDYDRNNGTTGTAWVKAGLTNDDEGFSVATIADVNEGSADVPGTITIRVVREGNLEGSSSVDWALSTWGANGVSTSGSTSDFLSDLHGTVNFDGSEQSHTGTNGQTYSYKDVTVTLKGDAAYEADETYKVTLSNAGEGSSIKSATATGKIINDDMGYFVSVKDGQTTVVEGNDGELASTTPAGTPPGTVTFKVTRECDSVTLHSPSTVAWRLSSTGGDVSAVEAADVNVSGANVQANGLTGTVEFLADETVKYITVSLVGDGVRESQSTLALTLQPVAGDTSSTMVQAVASVTLTDDDDTLSVVSLNPAQVAEGNTDTAYTSFVYEVQRTGSALGEASVSWAVVAAGVHGIGADDIHSILVAGVEVSAADFANGTLNWSADDMASKLIEVRIKHDRVGEWDEQFALTLSNPRSYGSTLGTATVTQTITNDDPALMLSMSNTRITEGNDPELGTPFSFVVTRTGDITVRSTVQWEIQSVSQTLDENDFGGLFPSGTVVFDPNESSKTVTVLTGGDFTVEGNEDFRIVLSNPVNATVVGPEAVQATIVDDDVAVSVRSVSGEVVEGQTGSTVTFQFAAEANGPSTATRATVRWHVEGAGDHPTIGNDFAGETLPRGTTEIALRQGHGFASIDVAIAGDNVYGPKEQFKIVIDDVSAYAGNTPMGASAVVKEATGTVLDDDLLIGLVQDSLTAVEGADGDYHSMKFYVEALGGSYLSPDLSQVRLDYHVSGMVDSDDFDTPLSDSDVQLTDDGNGGYYLELLVKGDALLEDHDQFKLQIDRAYAVDGNGGNIGNVEVSDHQAFVTGRILGDDYGIKLATVTTAQNEDSARFNFELTRLGPIDLAMDVQVQVGAPLTGTGDVVSSNDFINLDGFLLVDGVLTKTIHFEANQGTARFELEAAHDALNENDERFTVMASVDAVDDYTVVPTADEVSSIDCMIYDDEPGAGPSPLHPLDPVVDHHV
jgi:hypothetical protein